MIEQLGAARRALAESARAWRARWFRLALTAALVQAVATLPLIALSWVGRGLFNVEASLLEHGPYRDMGFVTFLGVEAFILMLLPGALSVLGMAGAIIIQTHTALDGETPRIRASIWQAIRRYPRMLGAAIVIAVSTLVLAGITAPLILLLRYDWPLIVFGLVIWWLRPQFRRQWLAVALLALIPMGLPLAALSRWILALPVIAVEGVSVRAALRRSVAIARGRWLTIALTMLVAVVVMVALEVGITWAAVQAVAGLHASAGIIAATAALGMPVISFFLDVIPAIALAVLYQSGMARLAERKATEPDPAPPSPRRSPRRNAPAYMRKVALGMLIAGVVPPYFLDATALFAVVGAGATVAHAAGPISLVVNDLGDTSDTTPGDGICATATGTCTLRAAAQEASADTPTGSGAVVNITFAVSGTISVASPISLGSMSGTGTINVDGTGHTVVVDGGGATSLLTTTGDGMRVTLTNLTLSNGSSAEGGALSSGTSGGTVLTEVTFIGNRATTIGGGAIYNLGSLTVINSTFVGDSAPAGSNGGDILNSGGNVTASFDTFWNATGGSLNDSVSSPGPITVNDSIIAEGPAGFGCDAGGSATGANNIGIDSTCPGVTNAGTAAAVMTGALGNHGGFTDTLNLLPGSPAITAADTGTKCTAGLLDQRGVARGASCDIGAYQFDPATTTSLAISPNPSSPGTGANLTATVSPSPHEPGPVGAGTVTFTQGTNTYGPVAVSGGTASFTTPSLTTGAYTYTATYTGGGAASWIGSASSPVTDNVTGQTTSLSVASPASQAILGSSITFTATLTAVQPTGEPAPTGTVTFYDGGTALSGAIPVSSDTATYTTSALPAGLHSITAQYAGDTYYDSSSAPAYSQDVQNTETAAFTATPSPVIYGNAVTYTVQLPTHAPSPVPTGTVTFTFNGSTSFVQGIDATGKSTFTTSALQLQTGSTSLTATYNGDNYYTAASAGTVTQVVNQAATTTLINATPSSTTYGQTVTLTASVTASGTAAIPVGTVTFMDGATTLGTAAVNGSGFASLAVPSGPTTPLSVGSHSLTSTFGATTNFGASSSASPASESVTTSSSTTSLSLSAPSTVYGQPLTLIANVTPPAGGTPTGTVTFFDGPTQIGPTATLAGGMTSITFSALAPGSHSIKAVYSGDGSFLASTSAVQTETVSPASTTTVVSVPGPAPFGTAVTLSATTAPVSPSAATPQGTVTFYDGATSLGSATLNSGGVASLTVSTLTGGTHSIMATYAGNADFATSASAAQNYTVSRATTTTIASVAVSPVRYDQGVTATVTLTSPTATSGFGGTVSFLLDGSTPVGSAVAVPSSGVVTVTITVPAGSHTLTAVYAGDADFAGSSAAPVSVSVTQAPTATAVTSSASPVLVGQSVTFTATLTSGIGGETGTVTFTDGATPIGTAVVSGGTASVSTSALLAGTHTITATYSGDANFLSSSAATSEQIAGSSTTTVVTSSANPAGYSQPVTFTATVTPASLGPAMTGTVTFYDGGTLVSGPTAIGPGVVTYTTSALNVAAHTITATYTGDTNYLGSTSPAFSESVQTNPTSITLTPSATSTSTGTPVSFTATFSTGFPTSVPGSVTFNDNGPAMGGPVPISGNSATFGVTGLPRGSDVITAVYTGATGFAAATGTTTVTVAGQPSFAQVILPSQVYAGQPVVISVSVASLYGPSSPAPTGLVTVTDNLGATKCTIDLSISTTCTTSWATATATGTYLSVTANYLGDAYYAPTASRSYSFLVNHDPTTTSITISTPDPSGKWITGEPLTVSWHVTGATNSTGTVNVYVTSVPGVVACTSTQVSGSCTVNPVASPSVEVWAAYFGDATNAASYASTVVNAVYQCWTGVTVTVSPAGTGTAGLAPGPNCDNGTGYIDGSVVTATAAPGQNQTFAGWLDPNGLVNTPSDTAAIHANVTFTAYFRPTCVRLHLFPYLYPYPLSSGAAFSNAGNTSVSIGPNCEEPDLGMANSPYEPVGEDSIGPYLLYTIGTPVTITALPHYNQYNQLNDLLNWYGDASGHQLSITVVMNASKTIDADFGLHCNAFAIGSAEGGTVGLSPGPNCTTFAGTPGYTTGTQVALTATAGTGYWFESYTVGSGSGVHTTAEGLQAFPTTYPGTTGTFVVYGATALNYTFAHILCYQLTVTNVWSDGSPQDYTPGPQVISTSDCPAMGKGWYAPGDIVAIQTPGVFLDIDLLEWRGGAVPNAAGLVYGDATVLMNQNRNIQAVFYQAEGCHKFTVNIAPAGAGTVTYSTPVGLASGCPDGMVPWNQYVTMTLHPAHGNPQLEFSGYGDFPPVISNTVSFRSNSAIVNAYVCEEVNAQVALTSPTGQVHQNPSTGEQNVVLDGGTCPYGWLVGSQVTDVALGMDNGHQFTGWSGDVPPGNLADTSQTLNLDGSKPVLTTVTHYNVVCQLLNVHADGQYDIAPSSNCPDYTQPSGSNTYSFVGGTTVVLHGYAISGDDFNGWSGDVGRNADPTYVYMDADTTASPPDPAKNVWTDYSSQTIGEKISNFFTSVGDDLAIVAKKAVGFATAFVGGYLMGKAPTGILMGADFLGQGLDSMLHAFGVNSNVSGALGSVIDVVQQSLTFVNSYFQCTATWALGSSGDASAAASAGKLYNSYQKYQDTQKAAAEAEAAGKTGLTVAQLQADAAEASLVNSAKNFALSDFSTPSWDSNATQAWTTGGASIQSCIEDAVPSYLGLPPVPPASGSGG